MPAHLFRDSDDEEAGPVVQPLSEFSNQTIEEGTVEAPLVIDRLPNTFRRGNKYIPQALQRATASGNGEDIAKLEAAEKARNNVYGLNKPNLNKSSNRASEPSDAITSPVEPNEINIKFAEEEIALRELVEPRTNDRGPTIASNRSNDLFLHENDRPDMSTMEDYEAVPVESFGLAMLRGMGYDPDTEATKTKAKEKMRRPDFLGLGATERPDETKNAEELAKKRFQKRKEERNYVPVIRINKRTGEAVQEVKPDLDIIRSQSETRAEAIFQDKNDTARSKDEATRNGANSAARYSEAVTKSEHRHHSRAHRFHDSRYDTRDDARSRRRRSQSPDSSRRNDSKNHYSNSGSSRRSHDYRKENRDRDRDGGRGDRRSRTGDRSRHHETLD